MIANWYAGIRVLHILFAALWVGTAVFLTLYVSPAIRTLGPRGAPVMAELMRRRMGTFIAVAGGLTVLSGLWMYWIFTNGLDTRIISRGPGLALGIGGVCGLIAVVLGGAVIGRAAERAGTLSRAAAQMPAGQERDASLQNRGRFAAASRVVQSLRRSAAIGRADRDVHRAQPVVVRALTAGSARNQSREFRAPSTSSPACAEGRSDRQRRSEHPYSAYTAGAIRTEL